MSLTVGIRGMKEGAHVLRGVMLCPTSPLVQLPSRSAANPGASWRAGNNIIPLTPREGHSAHKLGTKGNRSRKACVQGHPSPAHFTTLSAHWPTAPEVPAVFPPGLCLAHFTHSSWQEIKSREKGKQKRWVPCAALMHSGTLPAPRQP